MKHVALVMVVCLVALTAGCSYLKPNPERKIIGHWECPKLNIQFDAEHKFLISHADRSATGVWSYKDGIFELTVKNEKAKAAIDDQGRLVITPQNGKQVVLTKTKKAKTKPSKTEPAKTEPPKAEQPK